MCVCAYAHVCVCMCMGSYRSTSGVGCQVPSTLFWDGTVLLGWLASHSNLSVCLSFLRTGTHMCTVHLTFVHKFRSSDLSDKNFPNWVTSPPHLLFYGPASQEFLKLFAEDGPSLERGGGWGRCYSFSSLGSVDWRGIHRLEIRYSVYSVPFTPSPHHSMSAPAEIWDILYLNAVQKFLEFTT